MTRALVLQITLIVYLLLYGMSTAWSENPLYIENGNIHKFYTNKNQVLETNIKGDRILDQGNQFNLILSIDNHQKVGSSHDMGGNLFLMSATDFSTRKINTSVIRAKLSPSEDSIVIWNEDNLIYITDLNGSVLHTIGHGTSPIFSHTGNLIAYQKLAEISEVPDGHDLFEDALGIAIYDIKSKTDRLITFDSEDFSPVGFSHDENKLFFNSTRPYDDEPQNHVASVWITDIQSSKTERLTNTGSGLIRNRIHTPIISEDAIWSTDRKTVISSTGMESGVWKFSFSENMRLVTTSHVSDGDSPIWIEQDKTIASKIFTAGKTFWKKHSIQENYGGKR